MKAVLGFLFLLSGFTVAWLVLAGKLPNPAATTVASPGTIPSVLNNSTQSALMQSKNQGGGGPMGMKVGANANDMYASQGMMS